MRRCTSAIFLFTLIATAVYAQTPAGGAASASVAAGSPRIQKDPPAPVAPAVQTRDDATGRTTVRAIRLTAPFVFDGKLDESVYRDVPPITGFIQVLPDAGKASTEKTEAWVMFDSQNVYVAAKL